MKILQYKADFDHCYQKGTVTKAAFVRFWMAKNTHHQDVRLGLSVREAKTGVVRNWVRRRVKRWFLENEPSLPAGTDWVIGIHLGFWKLDPKIQGGLRGQYKKHEAELIHHLNRSAKDLLQGKGRLASELRKSRPNLVKKKQSATGKKS